MGATAEELKIVGKLGFNLLNPFQMRPALVMKSQLESQHVLHGIMEKHQSRMANSSVYDEFIRAIGDKARSDKNFVATIGQEVENNPHVAKTMDAILERGDRNELSQATQLVKNYKSGDIVRYIEAHAPESHSAVSMDSLNAAAATLEEPAAAPPAILVRTSNRLSPNN